MNQAPSTRTAGTPAPWGARVGSRFPSARAPRRLLLLLAWCVASALHAAEPPEPLPAFPPDAPAATDPESLATQSQSGQFVAVGPKPIGRRAVLSRSVDNSARELTPQTLAVSSERVKAEVLRILELPDTWRAGGGRTGKIFVQIDPRASTNTAPSVQATAFEQGWHFRVPLPKAVAQDVLVRTLTHAVVLELASRRGNARAPEIPLWLVEGLTQMVLSNVPEGVILQPESRLVAELRVSERLSGVRSLLSNRGAVEFHQLAQPDLSRMTQRDWDLYSASTHLCLHELLRPQDGARRLREWILHLQDHWNWQTGLVEAFQPQFRSLLDVEKWWALTVANFTGRTQSQSWPTPFALKKLEEALQPVGILPGAGNQANRLSVETVIADWDYARQVPVLREVLRQLTAIRLNAAPELSPLVFRYADLIEEYMTARARAGFSPASRSQPMVSVKLLARDTVGRLRVLDAERAGWSSTAPTTAQTP